MDTAHVLAPTLLEYWAVRRTRPAAHATWAGVRLARWVGARDGSIVIVCGLAGALTPDLSAGTVLVPEQVGLPDGRVVPCDPALVQAFAAAARSLRYQPDTRALLTAPSMVVGTERAEWSRRGFAAVDMETGLLAGQNLRVATVRVVLDSRDRDISARWLHSVGALLQPRLWGELFWLGRAAPPYARRAARVVRAGLERLADHDTL